MIKSWIYECFPNQTPSFHKSSLYCSHLNKTFKNRDVKNKVLCNLGIKNKNLITSRARETGKAMVIDSARAVESQQIEEETAIAAAAAKPSNFLPTVLFIFTPWLSVSNPRRLEQGRCFLWRT